MNAPLPRVPGAARHEVLRCRPGTAKYTELWAVPHLRCTADALHRVRDTQVHLRVAA